MTIKDDVLKAREIARSKELNPPVEITKEMRKEITDILTTFSRNGKHSWLIHVPLTEENTTNPFFSVKQVRLASWWRTAKYESSYRKGSLKRLIHLLDKEGVGAHVYEMGDSFALLSLEVKISPEPYVYVRNEEIEGRL
jgi:hypothetical protein